MSGDDIHRLASHVDDGCTSDPHGPYGFAADLTLIKQPSWAQGRSLPHRIPIIGVISIEGVDLIRRRCGEKQILRPTWCAANSADVQNLGEQIAVDMPLINPTKCRPVYVGGAQLRLCKISARPAWVVAAR